MNIYFGIAAANTFRNLSLNSSFFPGGGGANSPGIRLVRYEAGQVVIHYDNLGSAGVDVYQSADLKEWFPDGTESESGPGLVLERRRPVQGSMCGWNRAGSFLSAGSRGRRGDLPVLALREHLRRRAWLLENLL